MAITQVVQKHPCGFCNDKMESAHERCSVGVVHPGKHETWPNGVVWVCPCTCNTGRRKCHLCKNSNTDEVDPATWACFDQEACTTLVTTRRENNPFLAQLKEIKETVNMAKIENATAKAEKEQKAKEPTFCLVTGEPTKGGLFKPGMDARYVSERVASVENANFTKKAADEARKKMKTDGVSEKLVAKFEKSLGIAEDKAAKKAAAKAEKEAAKAEKASA